MEVADRVVVVTGGARGIGAGIARLLAAEGAVPVIVDRDAVDNGAALRAITAAGGQGFAVQAELRRLK